MLCLPRRFLVTDNPSTNRKSYLLQTSRLSAGRLVTTSRTFSALPPPPVLYPLESATSNPVGFAPAPLENFAPAGFDRAGSTPAAFDPAVFSPTGFAPAPHVIFAEMAHPAPYPAEPEPPCAEPVPAALNRRRKA